MVLVKEFCDPQFGGMKGKDRYVLTREQFDGLLRSR